MIKLYDYFRSSASFRVRIALNLKKIPYESIPIHLLKNGGEQYSEGYQLLNPQCLVPTMEEGGKVLTQSLAIIEYLNDQYPDPPLLPKDAYEKALVRSFALSIAADIHPLNNLRVLTYLTSHFSINESQKNAWYTHWITKGLSALEQQLLTHHRSTHFCFGDQISLADLCLIPQLYNARRYHCDLTPYSTLSRIEVNCQKIPAFSQAWPIEQICPA